MLSKACNVLSVHMDFDRFQYAVCILGCALCSAHSLVSRVYYLVSSVDYLLCSVQNAVGCVECRCSRRRRRVGCGGRIRPAASHYLLHSAQPSHLNCIQPTGFPQHTLLHTNFTICTHFRSRYVLYWQHIKHDTHTHRPNCVQHQMF